VTAPSECPAAAIRRASRNPRHAPARPERRSSESITKLTSPGWLATSVITGPPGAAPFESGKVGAATTYPRRVHSRSSARYAGPLAVKPCENTKGGTVPRAVVSDRGRSSSPVLRAPVEDERGDLCGRRAGEGTKAGVGRTVGERERRLTDPVELRRARSAPTPSVRAGSWSRRGRARRPVRGPIAADGAPDAVRPEHRRRPGRRRRGG